MLKVKKLSVCFGNRTVLQEVNLSVRTGETLALCGKNGAGKSTLAAALAGILKTKEGTVCVNGKPINDMKYKISFIPQQPSFMENVKVQEILVLYRSFYEHPLSFEELVRLGLLEDLLQKKTQELSGGERKRLSFALAMIGKPLLLIADEPTSGMDAEMKNHFYKNIKYFIEKGLAILLITHCKEEIEILAQRVVTLENGKITNPVISDDLKGVVGR